MTEASANLHARVGVVGRMCATPTWFSLDFLWSRGLSEPLDESLCHLLDRLGSTRILA
jgi:hypothetical protein